MLIVAKSVIARLYHWNNAVLPWDNSKKKDLQVLKWLCAVVVDRGYYLRLTPEYLRPLRDVFCRDSHSQ